MAALALAFDILAKDRASKEFDKVGDAADRTGKKGEKFGKALGLGLAAAAGAALAFGKKSVDAYGESEQASVRLDEALKNFPATNDRTRESFDKLNESLAAKTRFDDDATASGQAVLAQFKLTGTQIQELTPLLQDYAAKTGKDLPDAATVLGKAIQTGSGKALKDIGIDFKNTGDLTSKFTDLTGQLRTQVGGFATAEGQTAAGQAAILGNRFGEVQEKVGSKLVPALTDLAGRLVSVIDFVDRNSAVIVPLVAVLGTFATVVYAIITAAKIYTAVQTALNFVLAANPIGLIVLAIAALVTGIVIAYKNSETFRNIVQAVFKAVATAVLTAVDVWLGGFQKMFEVLAKIPIIGDKFKGVADKIQGARDKVNGLKNSLDKLPSVIPIRIEVGGNIGSTTGRLLDFRAAGGPLNVGRPTVVGERGPEVIVPGRSGTVIPNHKLGGSTYNLNVYEHVDEGQIMGLFRRMELLRA